MLQNCCKFNKSSEKFELNKTFLQISSEITLENTPKTIEEAINGLIARVDVGKICKGRINVLNISNDYINGVIDFGQADKLVKLNEALKEACISAIAEEVAARTGVRIVLIAGPSSSGKTTFCKKLTYALQQQGLKPYGISLDDFYVDRVKTPLDEDGEYDFESLYAIDLQLLNDCLTRLFKGEEVQFPRYDFPTGESRLNEGPRFSLPEDGILMLEGIHGLNPELVSSLPQDSIVRIYISALTVQHPQEMGIFEGEDVKEEFVATTDNRLIRRMVRDSQFRNTTAQQTLQRWASVRRGENKWIVPYQDNADFTINSSFQYELCLLRTKALPLLQAVEPNTPEYPEAQRLIQLLKRYREMPIDLLPPYSLLREFLGGSAYEY